MNLSMKDRALLLKLFYENNDCVPTALKKFKSLRGMKKKGCGSISANDLKIMIQKFEESCTFEVRKENNCFDVNSCRRYGHSISGRDEH